MHELSVMTQIVESVLNALKGRKVRKVESVRLEIGELTMLSKEALNFAWKILTDKGVLKGAKLLIATNRAKVQCSKCGYSGPAVHPSRLASHFNMPLIACPKCNGEIKVISGRECIIRSIKARVTDTNRGRKGAGRRKIGKEKLGKKTTAAKRRKAVKRTGRRKR